MLKTVGNPSTRYGDQTIVNGNLVIGTAGKGIDFSINPNNAGATSELLDDYEIGLHTATITPGTSGTVTLLSTSDTLSYVKIGSLVSVQGQLAVSSVASPVGAFDISLPFVVQDLAEASNSAAGSIWVYGGVSAQMADFVVSAIEGTATARVYLGTVTAIASSTVSAQQLQANTAMRFSIQYRAA
jgi:hypothetical protein